MIARIVMVMMIIVIALIVMIIMTAMIMMIVMVMITRLRKHKIEIGSPRPEGGDEVEKVEYKALQQKLGQLVTTRLK